MTAKHNLSAPFSGQMVSNVVCSVTTVNTTATQTTTKRFCKTKEILAAEKTKSQICLKYTNVWKFRKLIDTRDTELLADGIVLKQFLPLVIS